MGARWEGVDLVLASDMSAGYYTVTNAVGNSLMGGRPYLSSPCERAVLRPWGFADWTRRSVEGSCQLCGCWLDRSCWAEGGRAEMKEGQVGGHILEDPAIDQSSRDEVEQ